MTIIGAEGCVLGITIGVLYGNMGKREHAKHAGRTLLTGWDIRHRRCGERVGAGDSAWCAGAVLVSVSGRVKTSAA